MSKVYEAILRARTDQDLARRVERGAPKASLKTEIAAIERLPPLRMEKEMGRLFHNVAGLLSNSEGGIIQFIGHKRMRALPLFCEVAYFWRQQISQHSWWTQTALTCLSIRH